MSKEFVSYDLPEVVALFAGYSLIFPGEKRLFAKYIPGAASILDLGVGGGRTTPILSAKARRYVGLDFVPAMVQACVAKFPALEFVCADAADLSRFGDASFDVVVFSFNGLDTLPTLEKRARCLREVRRVLKEDGTFVFSAHNSRMLGNVTSRRKLIGSLIKTWPTTRELIRSGAFWKGRGYYRDFSHGDDEYYSSIPKFVVGELKDAGFTIVETAKDHEFPAFLVPWYYYVARRRI